ncbi:hypothetical protein JHU38_01525 [Prevotella sp. A2931]|uniref:Uncharacterized protein n=1 Tax=Prevotella illustrans TaxID=2800387 RepID=A0ABS3M2R2_9BACT|nr:MULTISPECIES: hypothetical protein [Prevotella]MBO1362475.1 hypothetical protein [Prevotella illustrans]PTL25532.1 hypothetical protein C3V39_09815 [Prevotella sp. oral taxon 820]
MKHSIITQRLGLFLFALVLVAPAEAESASDNEGNYFNIATKDNWQEFCKRVKSGETALNAKLTADIDLGSNLTMVGSGSQKYSGTFDGQGHTLTIDWNTGSADGIAPIQYVNGATIRNLHTKGRITSSGSFLSGLVFAAFGTNTISGCASDVTLTSNYKDGPCRVAGMVHHVNKDARIDFTDCLVKGMFDATMQSGKQGMGGFIYQQFGTCTLNNCIYLGTNNATHEFSYTFGKNANLKNCYYLNACGNAQGAPITAEQLKSGYVAKLLQADRTDRCYWAQVLGDMPDLYSEADKAKTNYVYYDAAKKRWACDDFRITDDKPQPIGLDFTAAKATYERDFTAGKATVCLPYELPRNGFKVYKFSGGNNGKVYFKEATDKIEAYKPYLLTADGTPQLGGENIQVKLFDPDAMVTIVNNHVFRGTISGMDNATAAGANAYILQDDGLFHKVTAGNPAVVVPPYHAYIVHGFRGAKQLSIVFEGETTGIDGMTDGTTVTDGPVYDLQGRRMADRLDDNARRQLPAGVYIVGGRKVVVK